MKSRNPNQTQVIPILFDTYLAVVKNSIGSKLFRNSYAKVNGKKKDILRNGELSCAFFVSSILTIFKLIKEIHGTVNGTLKDMQKSGWQKIKQPKTGSILVWEAFEFDGGGIHRHIGFYVGKDRAVSNSFKLKYPVIHHFTFGRQKNKPKRKIEAIFWHRRLDE